MCAWGLFVSLVHAVSLYITFEIFNTLCYFGSKMVRAFSLGMMGHRIDPSWGGPIELLLAPASDP